MDTIWTSRARYAYDLSNFCLACILLGVFLYYVIPSDMPSPGSVKHPSHFTQCFRVVRKMYTAGRAYMYDHSRLKFPEDNCRLAKQCVH